MRAVAAVVSVVVSGCSLNVADDGATGPSLDGCDVAEATCVDGVVTLSEYPGESCAMFDPPVVAWTCPGDCTTDDMGLCFGPGCAGPPYLCLDPSAEPLPAPFACDDDGAPCSGDATSTCDAVDACGGAIVVGTCTCTDGVETCAEACADGLCGAAAVQAALVGTWSGTAVTTWDTYSLRLTIGPGGRYDSERPGPDSAFYYGVDGGGEARRFHVIGQTEDGATAIVRIFFNPQSVTDGLATRLRIQDGHLTFELASVWFECSRYARFDLVREP